MLPGGILLACLGLLGFCVERWRYGGRGPAVSRIEIVMLLIIPAGAVVAVAGLILEVIHG